MKPNPFASLVRSRKFWLMIMDMIVSLITYFGGRYLTPATNADMIFLIGAFQPVIIAVILGIAYEDGAKAGSVIMEYEEDAATVDDVR